MHSTLKSITKQKIPPSRKQNCVSPEDLQSVMILFRQIRIFFYSSNEHCYFDCAVLTRFLRYCGFDAAWIFGVSTDPFEAHCWVQVGEIVVSDWQVAIDSFTPILII